MSGGHFSYKQYRINELIEEVEEVLYRLDLEPIPDNWDCNSLKPYVEDIPLVKQVIHQNILTLKQAFIYTQRLDRYLSGDDSYCSFKERLIEDFEKEGLLNKLPKTLKGKLRI